MFRDFMNYVQEDSSFTKQVKIFEFSQTSRSIPFRFIVSIIVYTTVKISNTNCIKIHDSVLRPSMPVADVESNESERNDDAYGRDGTHGNEEGQGDGP